MHNNKLVSRNSKLMLLFVVLPFYLILMLELVVFIRAWEELGGEDRSHGLRCGVLVVE